MRIHDDELFSDFEICSLFQDAFVFIFSIRPVPREFVLENFPESQYISQLLSVCNATTKEIRNRLNYKPSTRFLAVMHRSQFNARVIALRQSTISHSFFFVFPFL